MVIIEHKKGLAKKKQAGFMSVGSGTLVKE